ncbi:hypothetical protein VI26_18050 [Chromobacterium sp. LK1]|uniref:hypothetical protein n=1 Tax=Chromobacterium sp. LK1 TaxID=1628193 RepID=UPI000654B8EF|nr:hypothetical protein [Chromobacterium sp. LK1]KMN32074.1 hypothetical protein VI26_18050 [Chromobacterium sp. LK1]
MSELISLREFARRENCSDTLVRRAVKQGRLVLSDGGKLDSRLVGTAWREANAKGANTANTSANSSQGVRSSQFAPDDGANLSIEDTARSMIASGAAPDRDYAEALRVKENYLALLRQLEYEQKSGLLIELGLAKGVLFECARAARDAWLNWPARVGPLVAADLGLEADRVTEVLTEHVHKHIQQLGEPEGDFSAES